MELDHCVTDTLLEVSEAPTGGAAFYSRYMKAWWGLGPQRAPWELLWFHVLEYRGICLREDFIIPLDFSTFFFLLKMQQADHGARPPHIPSILRDPEMLLTGVIFALLKYFPA